MKVQLIQPAYNYELFAFGQKIILFKSSNFSKKLKEI